MTLSYIYKVIWGPAKMSPHNNNNNSNNNWDHYLT